MRIITFKQTEPKAWHAIVVPKACSLQSLSQHDINGNILIKSSSTWLSGDWNVYTSLLAAIARRISEILQFDSDGLIQFNSSAIPAEYNAVAVPARPVESSSPQVTPKTKEDAKTEKGMGQEGQKGPAKVEQGKKPKGEQMLEENMLEREWAGIHGEGEVNKPKEGDKVLHPSNLDIDRRRSQALVTDGNVEGRMVYPSDPPEPRAKSVPARTQEIAATKDSFEYPTQIGGPLLSTLVVDDTSDTATTPRPEPFDPTDPYQQMMRHEIKSSMHGLLKCLIEYIEKT